MGYALRLPGLTLTNPSAPKALIEPFGVSGLSHRFEADSFSGAAGSTITGGWLNKVSNTTTGVNSGTILVGPDLSVDTRTTKYKTADFTTANGDFGIDSVTQAPNTVVVLLGYKGLTTSRVFELGGRRLQVYNSGYELSSSDGSGTNKVQLTPAAVRPAVDKLSALIVTLSSDGSADSVTARINGATSAVSGPCAKSANTRIRIGKGSGTVGDGAYIAALAVWPRILNSSEITDTLIPALQTRYGIA